MNRNRFAPIAPLFEADAYKISHGSNKHSKNGMYPDGTEYIYSNFTNRASRIEGVEHVVAFGLQAFIQKYMEEAYEPFFAASEDEVAALYEERLAQILGPDNPISSDHIRQLHRKGYLPLRFRAVKEGTLVPLQVPTLTVENTEPEFFWLTNYIETILSASIWYPSTNATKDVIVRNMMERWAEKTGADKASVDWQWHDFSFRGQTSSESAATSGAAHLLTFTGSDNLNSLDFIDQYYPGDNGLVLGSVAATEHSVVCAGGQDNELETYRRLIRTFPTGILSMVSDTWDLFKLITEGLPQLHDEIMARDGKLVIRPDSGDPADILCGTVREIGKGKTPEEKGLIELLFEQFGGTKNEKGYISLDSHIGAIYGDSIYMARAEDIFERLAAKGFASDTIVFGAGSFHYQGGMGGGTTRDVFNSAMKATWCQIDAEGRDMMKDPKTAGGSKKSATGLLSVKRDETGEYYLIQHATREQEADSELELVWENGEFVRRQSFADVRAVLADERKRVYGN